MGSGGSHVLGGFLGPLGKSRNHKDDLLISEVGAEFRSTGLVNLSGRCKPHAPHVREASDELAVRVFW